MTTEQALRETLIDMAERAPTGDLWPGVVRRHRKRTGVIAAVAGVAVIAGGTSGVSALRPKHHPKTATIAAQPSATPTAHTRASLPTAIRTLVALVTAKAQGPTVGTNAFSPLGSSAQAKAERSQKLAATRALLVDTPNLVSFIPSRRVADGSLSADAITAGSRALNDLRLVRVFTVVFIGENGRTLIDSVTLRHSAQLQAGQPRAGVSNALTIAATSLTGTPFVRYVDFGDGSTTHPTGCNAKGQPAGTVRGARIPHTWTKPGAYQMSVSIQDGCRPGSDSYSFLTQVKVLA
jgi:hypothetical protein